MADRECAELFGDFFKLLASGPTEVHKAWACKLFEKTHSYPKKSAKSAIGSVRIRSIRRNPSLRNFFDAFFLADVWRGS